MVYVSYKELGFDLWLVFDLDGVEWRTRLLVYLSDQGWCGGGWYLYRTVGPCPRGTLFVSWHHSTFCDMILNKKEFVCKCITLKTSSKFTKKSVKHKNSLMVQVWRRLALQYKHFVISWEIEEEMLSGCGYSVNHKHVQIIV